MARCLRLLPFLLLGAAVLPATLSAQCRDGYWEPGFDHDMSGFQYSRGDRFIAVHASLVPKGPHRGEILVWNYYGNQPQTRWIQAWSLVDVSGPGPASFTNGELLLPGGEGDLFCAGHAWTAEGDLFVAGGTMIYEEEGHHAWIGGRLAFLYRPDQGTDGDWERQPDLLLPRWYPTVTMLADGRMLVSGGLLNGQTISDNYEVFDPATGLWEAVPGVGRVFDPPPVGTLDLYPRMHLLSDGTVFQSGMAPEGNLLDHLAGPGTWTFLDRQWMDWRSYGTSVLYPDPRSGQDLVLAIGGEGFLQGHTIWPMNDVSYILPGSASPQWRTGPPLNHARMLQNAAILPNGEILVVGGRSNPWYQADGEWVLIPEILDPETGVWREAAAHASPRDYHSVLLLLPDGRVLAAGGEARTTDYQIYVPGYLACGAPRPEILGLSSDLWLYGESPSVDYEDASAADPVARAVLLRPGSATHHFDQDLRYRPLEIQLQGNGSLTVQVPASPAALPPGYYMLFLVSEGGIPSVAEWVLVQ